jgi:hypothetical protein
MPLEDWDIVWPCGFALSHTLPQHAIDQNYGRWC